MFRASVGLKNLSQVLEYEFRDQKILLRALTRRSALVEHLQDSKIGDFQRLEFIGDKVLNLVISDILFENNPTWTEGQLTIEVSKFVNNKGPLAKVAKNIKLDKYLIMGLGEERNRARQNIKVLSDALEALVGAIWVDSENNYSLVKKFITKQFRLLGLIDFNQEYKSAVIKLGFSTLAAELMEEVLPEMYEAGGEERFGMTLTELLAFNQIKRKATKPLSGVAAFFEGYMNDCDEPEFGFLSEEGAEDDTTSTTDNPDALSSSTPKLVPRLSSSSKPGLDSSEEGMLDNSAVTTKAVLKNNNQPDIKLPSIDALTSIAVETSIAREASLDTIEILAGDSAQSRTMAGSMIRPIIFAVDASQARSSEVTALSKPKSGSYSGSFAKQRPTPLSSKTG